MRRSPDVDPARASPPSRHWHSARQSRPSRGACPEPSRGACPEPSRGACPEPSRGACPEPSRGPAPSPVEGPARAHSGPAPSPVEGPCPIRGAVIASFGQFRAGAIVLVLIGRVVLFLFHRGNSHAHVGPFDGAQGGPFDGAQGRPFGFAQGGPVIRSDKRIAEQDGTRPGRRNGRTAPGLSPVSRRHGDMRGRFAGQSGRETPCHVRGDRGPECFPCPRQARMVAIIATIGCV